MSVDSLEEINSVAEWSRLDSGSITGTITFPAGEAITLGQPVTVQSFKLKWWQRFLMWLFPRQFNEYYDVVVGCAMQDSNEGDTIGVMLT